MKLPIRSRLLIFEKLQKEAADNVFNLLELNQTIRDLSWNILPYKNIEVDDACTLILNKFNKLVAPYLNMKSVSVKYQGDVSLFMHDLIHEAIREGSISHFEKQDNSPVPLSEKYNLQDYIDEDVATHLSNTQMVDGIVNYFKFLATKIDRYSIKRDYKNREATVNNAVEIFRQTVENDLQGVQDPKQKEAINQVVKYLSSKMRKTYALEVDWSLSSPEAWTNLWKNLSKEVESFITKRYKNNDDSFAVNEKISSLLRRWILSCQNEINKLPDITKDNKPKNPVSGNPLF